MSQIATYLERLSWAAVIAGPMIVGGGELIGIEQWPVRLTIGSALLLVGLTGKTLTARRRS